MARCTAKKLGNTRVITCGTRVEPHQSRLMRPGYASRQNERERKYERKREGEEEDKRAKDNSLKKFNRNNVFARREIIARLRAGKCNRSLINKYIGSEGQIISSNYTAASYRPSISDPSQTPTRRKRCTHRWSGQTCAGSVAQVGLGAIPAPLASRIPHRE